MNENIIRAPRFVVGEAINQVFRLPSGKGFLFRVIGFGSLLFTLLFLLVGTPIIRAYIEMFSNIATLEAIEAEPDPEDVFAIVAPIFAVMGYFFLLYIGQYFLLVSIETALYKNIIRGEDKGFFPLRFGYDEWRVLGIRLVVGIILYMAYFIAYFVGILIFALIFGLAFAAASGGSGEPSIGLAIVGFVFFFIFFVGFIVAYLYMFLRLAPSAAISVRTREFNPIVSWAVMKSYVWPCLGAILIVGIVGYIILSIIWIIVVSILFMMSGAIGFFATIDVESGDAPDFSPLLDQMSSIGFIVPSVVLLVLTIFISLLFMSAIWSIWGYVAKLSDTESVLDQLS